MAKKTYNKIEKAFNELRVLGFFAQSNHMCCQTCAWTDIPEEFDNVVFYHNQDAEDLKKNKECYLSWSGDAKKIVEILEKHQVKVQWDGKETTRIKISL